MLFKLVKSAGLFAACTVVSAACFAGDLVLIRHGNSQHNMSHEYNSNPNSPNYRVSCLTPLGVKQAIHTAKRMLDAGYSDDNITTVYVSPLPRTRQTAKVLVEQGLFSMDKIVYDERLIEVDAGDREGHSTDEFDEDHWERHDAQKYNGETNFQVRQRVTKLYNDTVDGHKGKSGHVLYVTHGMPTYELIDLLTEQRIRLQTAESFVLPLLEEGLPDIG